MQCNDVIIHNDLLWISSYFSTKKEEKDEIFQLSSTNFKWLLNFDEIVMSGRVVGCMTTFRDSHVTLIWRMSWPWLTLIRVITVSDGSPWQQLHLHVGMLASCFDLSILYDWFFSMVRLFNPRIHSHYNFEKNIKNFFFFQIAGLFITIKRLILENHNLWIIPLWWYNVYYWGIWVYYWGILEFIQIIISRKISRIFFFRLQVYVLLSNV